MRLAHALESVRVRVTAGLAIMAAALALVAYLGSMALAGSGGAVTAMEAAQRSAELGARIDRLLQLQATAASRGLSTPDSLTRARFVEAEVDAARAIRSYLLLDPTPQERRMVNAAITLHESSSAWWRYAHSLVSERRLDLVPAAALRAGELGTSLRSVLAELQASLAALDLSDAAAAHARASQMVPLWWLLSVLATVGGATLAMQALRQVTTASGALDAVISRMARGDLRPLETGRFPVEFQDAARSLRSLLSVERRRAKELTGLAGEIGRLTADASERSSDLGDAADRAVTTAGALARGAGALEGEVEAAARGAARLAEQTETAADAADQLREQIEDLRRAIARHRGAMLEAGDSLRRLAAVVQAGAQQSSELEALVTRLDEFESAVKSIAAHSEVLSLNSAIENARKGALGGELQVVAAEVGRMSSLAQEVADRTGDALVLVRERVAEVAASMSGGRARARGSDEVARAASSAAEALTTQAGELGRVADRLAQEARASATAGSELAAATREAARHSAGQATTAAALADETRAPESEARELGAVASTLHEKARELSGQLAGQQLEDTLA